MTPWWDGHPSEDGTYLVAWSYENESGTKYIYEVHTWSQGEWVSLAMHRYPPRLYSPITSPLQQDEMLEELYKTQ